MSLFDLYKKDTCIILGNVWDTLSAMVLEQSGFTALGTTSWGIANSLGYNDGEKILFSDYFRIIKKIRSVCRIPLSIDLESGFSSDEKQIIEHVLSVADIGCSGINIEDGSNRTLKNKDIHAKLIYTIKNTLIKEGYSDFFVNARTDTYLSLENPLEETLSRAILYESSGADGIFIPGLTDYEEIRQVVDGVNIPVNCMMMPGCDIDQMKNSGVRRISFGNALSDSVLSYMEKISKSILTQHDVKLLFNHEEVKTKFKD